jgi:hypothetical protein
MTVREMGNRTPHQTPPPLRINGFRGENASVTVMILLASTRRMSTLRIRRWSCGAAPMDSASRVWGCPFPGRWVMRWCVIAGSV